MRGGRLLPEESNFLADLKRAITSWRVLFSRDAAEKALPAASEDVR